MATSLSAETQKWFDQNQTNRSTSPISALAAASKRALASLKMICCGSGGSTPGNWAICEGASPLAVACFCCRDASFCSARRSARKSETSRAALALDIRFGASIWPAPGRSRSASSAPRGSAAIAAIVSPTGPKPNLWRPSAAAVFPELSPLFALMESSRTRLAPRTSSTNFHCGKSCGVEGQKVEAKHNDPFIYDRGRRTACGS